MLASISDQILSAIFHFLRHAENTSFNFTVFHIFHTPGGPDVIHRMDEL